MNKIDFINEVKKSNFCPDNFDLIYNEFQFYQDKAFESLCEFHRICEKNNILYTVMFGSLLGIIRDQGQIPWDYDMDVAVPFQEKNKLVDALEKDLSNDYYFYCIEKDDKCRHMIMRLAPKGFKSESLHLDVFFFIGAPDDYAKRQKFAKKIKKMARIRFYKLVNVNDVAYKNIKRKIKLYFIKLIVMPYRMDKIMNKYNFLCSMYNWNDSKNNISADGYALKFQFEKFDLWNTKIIELNNQELRIPINYEKILKILYGDYKKIFPLESRINELMKNYKYLHRHNYKLYCDSNKLK